MPDIGLNSFKDNILNLFLLVENRTDSRTALLDELTKRTRNFSLERSFDSATFLMSQYQQQGDLEVFNSILQAAEFGKPRYVTGNPDNKYVTEPLVQNVFGADPGVRAAKDRG